jgi:hypothetical protein
VSRIPSSLIPPLPHSANNPVSNAVDAVRDKVLTKPTEPDDWLKADQVEGVAPNEEKNMYVRLLARLMLVMRFVS